MKTGVLVTVVLLLSGCTLGPDYKRPPVPRPPSFRGVTSSDTGATGSLAQRGLDQLLEDLVLEEIPPRQVGEGPGGAGVAGRHAAEGRRPRHRWALVVGAQGAAGQQEHHCHEHAGLHACCSSGTCPGGGAVIAGCAAAARRRPSRSTKAKLPGMRNTPSAVATSIPKNTAEPMTFWAPAPAPLARINGTTPRMNAKAVMRIGRNRRRADSRAASSIDLPSSCLAFANSTMRMAFLAASPISMMLPICT